MTTPSNLPDNKEFKDVTKNGNRSTQSNNSPLSQDQFRRVWTYRERNT